MLRALAEGLLRNNCIASRVGSNLLVEPASYTMLGVNQLISTATTTKYTTRCDGMHCVALPGGGVNNAYDLQRVLFHSAV